MNRAVVLLSAGLDSTYNLYKTAKDTGVRVALTFDYGQKAAEAEKRQAAKICQDLNVCHKIIDVTWFKQFTQTSLISTAEIPSGRDVSIDDLDVSLRTKKAVWVPNRNGIFLNIAAGFAEGLDCRVVVPGFNSEEAATFPDNTEEYLQSLNHAFKYSTQNGVSVKCYSTKMTKTEIVRDAVKIGVPLHLLWPCYRSAEKWCGECESCQRFKRAVADAGAASKIEGCFR